MLLLSNRRDAGRVHKSVHEIFGAEVRNLRKQRGWTQEDLAEMSGVGREHISRIENGLREACLETIVQFAKAFKISVSDLTKGL
jgi:transcriptional regulator with XRE-family HTH domain